MDGDGVPVVDLWVVPRIEPDLLPVVRLDREHAIFTVTSHVYKLLSVKRGRHVLRACYWERISNIMIILMDQ